MRPKVRRAAIGSKVDAQPLPRALDVADRIDGDAGVERGRLELGVSEQHLDHANVNVLLEQMGGDPRVKMLWGLAAGKSVILRVVQHLSRSIR